jgi:hypothetical protein
VSGDAYRPEVADVLARHRPLEGGVCVACSMGGTFHQWPFEVVGLALALDATLRAQRPEPMAVGYRWAVFALISLGALFFGVALVGLFAGALRI